MSQVRKAVILAAGLGTRMLPATKAVPKELLPIVDKPLVQYAVEEAVAAGIDQVVFVGDPWYEFDPVAAKALLAEAGFPDGFDTTITYRDVVRGYLPHPGVVAQDLQAQLKENLNINTEIVVMESGTFLDETAKGTVGGFHLLGWTGDYPDMTNFMDYHFGAGASQQFGTKWDDITDNLTQAAQLADNAEREPFYTAANNAIRQHVPMLPISHGGSAVAYKATVQGANVSALGNEYFPPASSKIKEVLDFSNLIEVQKRSYEKFLQSDVEPEKREYLGLQAVFKTVFPIKDFYETASLEFVSYRLTEPKYDMEECLLRGMTYASPIKVTVRLVVWDVNEETRARSIKAVKEQVVYFGVIPLMTNNGTFIINGTERVIVSQLHRSPGVSFDQDQVKPHAGGKTFYYARIIPSRGSWIDFEFDQKDLLYVRIDRRRKIPVTVLLRALKYTGQVSRARVTIPSTVSGAA